MNGTMERNEQMETGKVRRLRFDAVNTGYMDKYTLITGGAGFIGTNLADRLLRMGRSVLVFDNFSRPGVEINFEWLRQEHGERAQLIRGDVRDRKALKDAIRGADSIFHFAAQVAVTTSLHSPVFDFEVNAMSTLNILEELRALDDPPPLVFTSTNKVYGGLEDIELVQNQTRYYPSDQDILENGISETRNLDFHSPYGCSKGAADQYVIDYARTFSVPAAVFRMSCICGPHQCGTEDQGWVAHFLISALEDRRITIYGDGMQVRDILFVDDLLNAFIAARENISSISGQAFNIGGGPKNSVSLLELIDLLGRLRKKPVSVEIANWRPADQRYFVSDTRRFASLTGWQPEVGVAEGIRRMFDWFQTGRLSHRGFGASVVERW